MLQSNYYFKSKDIKVFPSSFRGNYTITTTIDGTTSSTDFAFDPESRLNTEANFTAPGITLNHPSYIVDYGYDKVSEQISYIKFVLGGYYFELYNASDYISILPNKSIGITLRKVALSDSNSIDSARETLVLDSWPDTTDYTLDIEDGGIFYFVGLKILESDDDADHSIILLTQDPQEEAKPIKINQAYLLANIDHGTGENTLLHGEGLQAGTTNQTVFGKYNANKESSLFEIGNGKEEGRNNALEISPDITTINTNNTNINGALRVTEGVEVDKSLTVKGDTNLTNTVIVKAAPTENDTDVKIDGTLNVTGKTNIYSNVTIDSDKTTLGKPVEITDTSDAALVVSGKTTVKKDLEIGDTTKVLVVKNNPSESEQNVTITGTLKSTDKATFENGLEVASGKTTTLGGQVDITGTVNINTPNQKNPITVYGDASITGAVNITGKVTSNYTKYADTEAENATLTTKKYVDDKIADLEALSVGGNGSYLQAISESGGIITATAQSFDASVSTSSTSINAPTSQAVSAFVQSAAIKQLMYNAIYPIGSIYMTMEDLTNGRTVRLNSAKIDPVKGTLYAIFDPANTKITIRTRVGGFWQQISQGRVLLGAGAVTLDDDKTQKDFEATDKGGHYMAQPYTHKHYYHKANASTNGCTLTLDQLPRKDFGLEMYMAMAGGDKEKILRHAGGNKNVTSTLDDAPDPSISNARLAGVQVYTGNSKYVETRGAWNFYYGADDGEADSHSHPIYTTYTATSDQNKLISNVGNMPPYLVCYIWQRVE